MQSPPKPPFATWLLAQVETGRYVGLRFVDQNRFRVPWKHNSRRDCTDDDVQIFRAWAVASGKIHQFPNNKARWKTNFRCALNVLSTHFRMVEDNSRIQHDPHRIYEVLNPQHECSPGQKSPQEFAPSPNIHSSPTEPLHSGHVKDLSNNFRALDLEASPPEPGPSVQTNCPAGAQNFLQVPPARPPACMNPPSVLNPTPSLYDLEISIHYRKTQMLKMAASGGRLQLHYRHEAPEFRAQHLCFPVPDGLLDRKQADFTNRILDSVRRGVLLEVHRTGVYATRQDRCHVFFSTDASGGAPLPPQKLPQSTTVQLLSFAKYMEELRAFRENGGSSPAFTISMCFGEKFPDGKPLEKKLVVVKVVPLICRHLHEVAQMEGASSLTSTSLQISLQSFSLFDLINAVFSPPAAEEPFVGPI